MAAKVEGPFQPEGHAAALGVDSAVFGDRKTSFEALVLLHLNAAYTLARYLTRRADLAEDVVQEALLRAYRSFEGQRGENVRAWLLAIVRNCFLSSKARDRQWQSAGEEADIPGAAVDRDAQDQETPESILMKHEESGAIRAVIEGLPHTFREVLVLRDLEDLSYREIAEVTGVPLGTVMSRLARARKMFAVAWKALEAAPKAGRLQ